MVFHGGYCFKSLSCGNLLRSYRDTLVSLNKRGVQSSCLVLAPVSWTSPDLFFSGHESLPVPQKLKPLTRPVDYPVGIWMASVSVPLWVSHWRSLLPGWRMPALRSSRHHGFVPILEPQDGNKPECPCLRLSLLSSHFPVCPPN